MWGTESYHLIGYLPSVRHRWLLAADVRTQTTYICCFLHFESLHKSCKFSAVVLLLICTCSGNMCCDIILILSNTHKTQGIQWGSELCDCVCVYINILVYRYPPETMKRISQLSEKVSTKYRESRKNKLKRTFVEASDAAEAKAKRR